MNRAICLAIVFCAASVLRAEDSPPAASQSKADASLVYEVVAVQGSARVGPMDLDPKSRDGWTLLKPGDEVRSGQQIHTAMRGKVKLVARPAEPPTVIALESGTLVIISELEFKDGAARSRIHLPYGAVKAGVAEGATRSDMEIESPSATLSKKGTDIFRIEYGDGRFNISLSEQGRGLLQMIQMQQTNLGSLSLMRSRFITPGQFITHQLARAIDAVQFDREINVNDVFGLGGADQLFTMLNDRGFGFLLPTGHSLGGLIDNNGNQLQDGVNPDATQGTNGLLNPLTRQVRFEPGGTFGIGQGPLPNPFDGLRRQIQRPVSPLDIPLKGGRLANPSNRR